MSSVEIFLTNVKTYERNSIKFWYVTKDIVAEFSFFMLTFVRIFFLEKSFFDLFAGVLENRFLNWTVSSKAEKVTLQKFTSDSLYIPTKCISSFALKGFLTHEPINLTHRKLSQNLYKLSLWVSWNFTAIALTSPISMIY